MPRTMRKASSTDIYHVMIRGVDRMDIFRDDQDRHVFLSYLKMRLDESGGDICAWCLMTNHVHLLVRFELGVLSQFMRELGAQYALYFNSRHRRCGHLFQNRFKSEPVEDEAYFLTAVRYIHQNPAKAFMVKGCRYRWSSFEEYLGDPVIANCGLTLEAFGGLPNFLAFHRELAFQDRCLEVSLELSDEEAASYAAKVVGADQMRLIGELATDERNAVLRTLAACMMPVAQIARITGFGKSTVYQAVKS